MKVDFGVVWGDSGRCGVAEASGTIGSRGRLQWEAFSCMNTHVIILKRVNFLTTALTYNVLFMISLEILDHPDMTKTTYVSYIYANHCLDKHKDLAAKGQLASPNGSASTELTIGDAPPMEPPKISNRFLTEG